MKHLSIALLLTASCIGPKSFIDSRGVFVVNNQGFTTKACFECVIEAFEEACFVPRDAFLGVNVLMVSEQPRDERGRWASGLYHCEAKTMEIWARDGVCLANTSLFHEMAHHFIRYTTGECTNEHGETVLWDDTKGLVAKAREIAAEQCCEKEFCK